MTRTRRSLLFAALVVACTLAAAVTVVSSMRSSADGTSKTASASSVLAEAKAGDRPMVMMLANRDGSTQAGGVVAVAPLDDPLRRTDSGLHCDRVYFAGDRGLCLAPGSGFAAGYTAKVFDADFRVFHKIEVEGVASRARVSPDGRLGSVTMFVAGHSYAEPGAFSTQTTLIDMERGQRIGDLEDFTVIRGDRQVTAIDVNFWGVTFSAEDSDRFFATMATGGKTFLIEGSIEKRSATVVHENVECPSLSPDGTRVAYKQATGSRSRSWRLSVLDLETMQETELADMRSVDDQAEWLNDDELVYAVGDDLWAIAADGGGRPRRFEPGAGSPAVVRW
jgi:hypothetical protein